MKSVSNVLMKGLAAVLPIGLTIYVVWWLAATAESLMRRFLTLVIAEQHYYPGMGILVGLVLLLIVGTLVNAYVVRRVLGFWEEQFARIPVVKTIYGAIRDVARLLPASGGKKRDLQSVVVVQWGDVRMIGFVTRDELPELELQAGGVDLVAVYFPMSYMIGGYTVFVPKASAQPLDMPVEAAMRLVLTGGVATTPGGPGTGSAASVAPASGPTRPAS
ncbi:MAG: DUF502 domain-containing protein [Pseudomonadota bacterium]|jgi:uncharacterized membrane protein